MSIFKSHIQLPEEFKSSFHENKEDFVASLDVDAIMSNNKDADSRTDNERARLMQYVAEILEKFLEPTVFTQFLFKQLVETLVD